MPLTSLVHEPEDLVVTRGWGTLDDDDLVRHQDALASNAAFVPSMRQIVHLEEVEETVASAAGIRRFAALDPFAEHTRRAIVVPPGQLVTFGVMRMFAHLATTDVEFVQVQFDHLDQARRWLGLDDYPLPSAPGA